MLATEGSERQGRGSKIAKLVDCYNCVTLLFSLGVRVCIVDAALNFRGGICECLVELLFVRVCSCNLCCLLCRRLYQ